MTEREAFIRAIAANPADDLPRLVYADFLEENGEPERAEFIRFQCELAAEWDSGDLSEHDTAYREAKFPAYADLRKRERELLHAHWSEWAGPLAAWPSVNVQFRRGFIWLVRANLDDLMSQLPQMGPELLCLGRARTRDKRPAECLTPWNGCHFVWMTTREVGGGDSEHVISDPDLYAKVSDLADYADGRSAGFRGQIHTNSHRLWPDNAVAAMSCGILSVCRMSAGL